MKLRNYYIILLLALGLYSCGNRLGECEVKDVDITVEQGTVKVKANVSTLAGIEQFNWLFSDGFSKATLTNEIEHIVTKPGSYSVKVEAELDNGNMCSYAKEFQVNQSNLNNPDSCDIDIVSHNLDKNKLSIKVNSTAVSPNYYFFDFGDGDKEYSATPDAEHIFKNPGTYTVKASFNKDGCTDTSKMTVTVTEIVHHEEYCTFDLSVDDVRNNLVELSVDMPDNFKGNYRISFGDGNNIYTNKEELSHVYLFPGTHTIKLSYTENGCNFSIEKKVVINQIQLSECSFSLNAVQIMGDTLKLSITPGIQNTTLEEVRWKIDGVDEFDSSQNWIYVPKAWMQPGVYVRVKVTTASCTQEKYQQLFW